MCLTPGSKSSRSRKGSYQPMQKPKQHARPIDTRNPRYFEQQRHYTSAGYHPSQTPYPTTTITMPNSRYYSNPGQQEQQQQQQQPSAGPRSPYSSRAPQHRPAPSAPHPSQFPGYASYEAAARFRTPDHRTPDRDFRELVQGRAQVAAMPGFHGQRRDLGARAYAADPTKRVTQYAYEEMAGMPGFYGR